MDAPAVNPLGGDQRPGHRACGGNHSCLAAASTTGFPFLFRDHASGETLTAPSASKRPVGGHSRSGPVPTKYRIDPQKRARPPPVTQQPDLTSRPSHPNIRGPNTTTTKNKENANAYASHIGQTTSLRLTGMYHGLVEQIPMPDMAALSFEERFGSWSTRVHRA